MQKAFIFDLDGVLINNETVWDEEKEKVFSKLLGKEKVPQLGSTVGLDVKAIYNKIVQLGATISLQEMHSLFEKKAESIYRDTPIANGIQELGKQLLEHNYALAIVSASPREWMDLVINRLEFKNDISVTISLHEREDLETKPSPDGYLEAIKELHSKPELTVILEDSNTGIASAKASGAYVIGLKENLTAGYYQHGADIYAETLNDVMDIVLKHESH